MERVPAYLVVYLIKIRKHSGEFGYLKRRLENVSLERAVYEKSMLRELLDLRLIALSDKEDEIVFDPLVVEVEPGVIIHRSVTENRVSIPNCFTLLARGHYLWLEWLGDGAQWLVASLIGALIALLISA